MTISQLIAERVSDSRGGYRPEEVKELMRQAYELGRANKAEVIKAMLDDVKETI